MQIHELPDVTAIGSGGYFATDNGSQTTKIDYDALAKAIIEQYSASTLAGSAQSVKAALDGLMQKSLPTEIAPRTTIASGDDLNAYTSPGIYRCATASIAASLSNCPISSVGFNLDVVQLYNVAFAYQRITASTGTTAAAVVEVYERFINVRDSMYGTWKKVPTRAEVDALTPTEITTLTSAVGTLTYKCFKQGKVIGVALQIAVSDAIPANTVIVEGLPLASKGANYTVVPFANNTASALTDKYLTAEFRRAGDTYNEILTRYAIPANGSIRMNFTYLAEN
jgi:hypothetical protein